MRPSKRKKLEEAGWQIGSTSEFLGLTPQEEALVEMKLSLADSMKSVRQSRKMTQGEVAKLIKSSQSRVAKMEACDPSVSMELYVRSLAAMGAPRKEIGNVVGGKRIAVEKCTIKTSGATKTLRRRKVKAG